MTVSVQWLFLTAPWVDLQCVIVVFPNHIHLLVHFDFGDFSLIKLRFFNFQGLNTFTLKKIVDVYRMGEIRLHFYIRIIIWASS